MKQINYLNGTPIFLENQDRAFQIKQIADLKQEILRLELKNEVLTEDLRLVRLKLNEQK